MILVHTSLRECDKLPTSVLLRGLKLVHPFYEMMAENKNISFYWHVEQLGHVSIHHWWPLIDNRKELAPLQYNRHD